MPIYMKFGSIKGDVTEDAHKDWIELHSLQWGVGRGVASPTGSSADRESSAPSISEITVTKNNDIASSGILSEALQGDGSNGKTVEIDFVRTDKGKLTVYQKIALTDVIISGYSVSSGGDRPTESLSLNFIKIAVTDTQMKPDGTAGSPSTTTYDLSAAKTV